VFDRRQKIMEKIQTFPKGSISASGRYWCVTCKKLFRIEQPVCSYMTAMCVNSPIAIENFPWKFEFGEPELLEVQRLLGLS